MENKNIYRRKREFWSVIREEFIVPVRIVERIKKAVKYRLECNNGLDSWITGEDLIK